MNNIIFVTASHKEDVLRENLLKSKIFEKYPLIIQRNYTNVPQAYNEAKCGDGIRVYLHQDVFLPDSFEINLWQAIAEIEERDPNWGVLGVAGVIFVPPASKATFGNLCDRGNQWGDRRDLPREVDTLDELILIVKDKDLKFDEDIPSPHFYGADICLQAKLRGMKNYAINAYLYHNSTLGRGERPQNFWIARDYIKNKYRFPIATTCTIIT